jgi:hypothetical protein
MLERLSGGRLRSTPHRVRNRGGGDRLSFPLFFDPAFDAAIEPLPAPARLDHDPAERWDGESVHAAEGPYGDYLLRKVGRVFPGLRRRCTHDDDHGSASPRFGFGPQVLAGLLAGSRSACWPDAWAWSPGTRAPGWPRRWSAWAPFFVQLLRVLVPPLIFTAIVASIAGLRDLRTPRAWCGARCCGSR